SFRVGAVKPERAIYEQVSLQLNCPLSSMVMIGDTLEADCLGPRRFGMRGFHLNRSGRADVDTFADLTSFFSVLIEITPANLRKGVRLARPNRSARDVANFAY
ncbi:HAD family hydrolase, partial [Pseudomonas sp. ATCC 13867]